MALYFNRDEYRRKPGTRSNLKLRISGGDGPATQYIADKTLPVLFEYPYGGPGQKDIIISKGMVVAVKTTLETDFETQKKRTVLTLPGRPGAGNVVGMVPYNVARPVDDQLTANMPTIWTRDYVELPLLRNADDAALVKWGAVYQDGDTIVPGDYLVANTTDPRNLGKLIKYKKGVHDPADIVGQVLELEIDSTPFGWLEWVMWDEAAYKQDVEGGARKLYPTPGEDDENYGYDPAYRDGTRYLDPDGYFSRFSTKGGQGIPGLTDGANRGATVWTKSTTVPAGFDINNAIVVRLDYKNVIADTVIVKLDGNPITTFNVDERNGIVYVTLEQPVTADATLTISYRARMAGTPAGWDFLGTIGAAKILLKR